MRGWNSKHSGKVSRPPGCVTILGLGTAVRLSTPAHAKARDSSVSLLLHAVHADQYRHGRRKHDEGQQEWGTTKQVATLRWPHLSGVAEPKRVIGDGGSTVSGWPQTQKATSYRVVGFWD